MRGWFPRERVRVGMYEFAIAFGLMKKLVHSIYEKALIVVPPMSEFYNVHFLASSVFSSSSLSLSPIAFDLKRVHQLSDVFFFLRLIYSPLDL